MLLYTAGRVGATKDLGLENCGLTSDKRGRLSVNPSTFQTAVDHIYAMDDVVKAATAVDKGAQFGKVLLAIS